MMLAKEIANDLGLTFRIDYASDPSEVRRPEVQAVRSRLADGALQILALAARDRDHVVVVGCNAFQSDPSPDVAQSSSMRRLGQQFYFGGTSPGSHYSSTSTFASPTPQARSVRFSPSNLRGIHLDAVRINRPLNGRLWAMNVQEVQLQNLAPESSRVQFCSDRPSFRQRAAAVAAAAATEVEAVDREARFPRKAIDAARKQRLERAGAEISLRRDATVISYGAEADGIITIARRRKAQSI